MITRRCVNILKINKKLGARWRHTDVSIAQQKIGKLDAILDTRPTLFTYRLICKQIDTAQDYDVNRLHIW